VSPLLKAQYVVDDVSSFLKCVAEIKKEWFDAEDPWGPWFRGQRIRIQAPRPQPLSGIWNIREDQERKYRG
jgi:hypothetical protein